MNSVNNATGQSSKIEAIAQFLATRTSSEQTASGSTSFGRQVIGLDQPYCPGIKRRPDEAKPVTQGRNLYPLAEFDGQHSQTYEQQSGKADLSLEERKVFQCTFDGCGKSYTRLVHLQKHQFIHKGEKPFICEHEKCGKGFTQKSDLAKHERIHTGERPFVCDYDHCKKRFIQMIDLKRHKLTHTGEKPFECKFKVCGKKFNMERNLKRHGLVHTGIRPHICEHEGCGRGFLTKQNMLRHAIVHTKDR